jgi:hypothetical protein
VSTPPPNASSDDPVIAATTWILIQYEVQRRHQRRGPVQERDRDRHGEHGEHEREPTERVDLAVALDDH